MIAAQHNTRIRSGFTLVELSIVLVIVALVVGGIIVGQALVRNARHKQLITEIENLKKGLQTFRLKYNCIPGDCAQAQNFFGTDPAGCGTSVPYNTTPTNLTCNGNGNGKIGDYNGYATEVGRAIQQLADAELIDGQYTGTCQSLGASCTSGHGNYKTGLSMPVSKAFSNGGFLIYHQGSLANGGYGSAPGGGLWHWNSISRGNVIYFSSDQNIHWGQSGAIDGFTGPDAYAVDSKIDDGKPGLGNIVTLLYPGTCNTAAADTASIYTTTTVACSIVINSGS